DAIAVAVATAAIAPASVSVTNAGSKWYRAAAATSVAYAPPIPAPTAARAEYVCPYRRRSQRPPANTSIDAIAPIAQRCQGPIQPRLTASTKRRTTPSSVTVPPATARARAASASPSRRAGEAMGAGSGTCLGAGRGALGATGGASTTRPHEASGNVEGGAAGCFARRRRSVSSTCSSLRVRSNRSSRSSSWSLIALAYLTPSRAQLTLLLLPAASTDCTQKRSRP